MGYHEDWIENDEIECDVESIKEITNAANKAVNDHESLHLLAGYYNVMTHIRIEDLMQLDVDIWADFLEIRNKLSLVMDILMEV